MYDHVKRVGALLRLSKTIFRPSQIGLFKDGLSIPNPKYESTVKHAGVWVAEQKKIPKIFTLYEESTHCLMVPRNYLEDSLRKYEGFKGVETFRFKSRLWPFQQEFYGALPNYADMIFNVPCGHGKTTLALYHACTLKVRTLVLVPTNLLAKQWAKRVTEYTDAKVSILSDNSITGIEYSLNFSQVVILTMDMYVSINGKFGTIFGELLRKYGYELTISDECHRLGAETLMPVMSTLDTLFRLSLTATFRRHDGMEKLLLYHFGHLATMNNQFDHATIVKLLTGIKIGKVMAKESLKFPRETLDILSDNGLLLGETRTMFSYSNPPDSLAKKLGKDFLKLVKETSFTLFDSYASEHRTRLGLISTGIELALEEGRTIMVLGKRLSSLKYLHSRFKDKIPCALITASELKGSEQEDKIMELLDNSRIIFGIEQLAKEGLDAPKVDTLFVISYIADLEQAIGRIVRQYEGKKSYKAFYYVDDSYVSNAMFQKAMSIPMETVGDVITTDRLTEQKTYR